MLIFILTHHILSCYQAKQLNISHCQTMQLQKNEFYISQFDTIFLESKDQNFNMPQLQHQLIIEKQIIQNFSDQDNIILQTFVYNVDDNQNFINQFCWLNNNTTTYYITCKQRMYKFLLDNQIIFGSEVTTQIEYLSETNYTCEDLFINEQQIINIFCFSDSNIHITQINMKGDISKKTFNHSLSTQFSSCTKQILNTLQENLFIIGFTKCKQWSVLFYNGSTDQSILNITNLIVNIFESHELTNIQLCQNNLYLIFKNQYIEIDIVQVEVKFIKVFEEQDQILTLLFQDTCFIYSQVFISETISNQISIFNDSLFISITQIPDNIYYWKNLLILQYSSQIYVMMNQRIIQNYELQLSTLKYDKVNNLFYGYDYNQNQITAFELQHRSGFFQYNNYNYFLQVQTNNLLLLEEYIAQNCLYILEQDSSQFYGSITNKNIDQGVRCLSENYIYFQYPKLIIKSNKPIIYKVAQNSRIVSISDRKEWKLICQPKIKGFNSKNSFYQLIYHFKGTFTQAYVWKSDKQYILQQCKGEQLYYTLSYNQHQTLIFNYVGKIILVSLEHQEVKIYDFSAFNNTYKIIKLPEKISQVNQFESQIVFQAKNCTYIYILNLNKVFNFFFQFEKQFNGSKVLFFFQHNQQNQVIQYEKQLYIIFQDTHSVFSFQDHLIIHSEFEISQIIFYAIDQIENKIITYIYIDSNLIFQEQLNLNNYEHQIHVPIKFYFNKAKMVIATKNQSGDLFLFIINLQTILAQSFDKIIEIGKLEFFCSFFLLYFYDRENKIQVYQFESLNMTLDIKDVDYYQNVVKFNQNLILQSQITPFDELNLNITFQFSNLCKKINKLPTSQKILNTSASTIKLNLKEYFSGPIEKLKLLDTSYLELQGPFLLRQKLQQCNNQLNYTSCIYIRTIKYQGNSTLKIQLIQLENELQVIKIINNDQLSISIQQIYHLGENDQILIINHYQNLCVFSFYEFNSEYQMYIEQTNQYYDCLKFQITYCKKQGNILMLQFQKETRFFLIFEQSVKELHWEVNYQFDDFFIIKNTPNQFVLLETLHNYYFTLIIVDNFYENQLYLNSSYKIDEQQFQLELLQYELQSQIDSNGPLLIYKSFKIEHQYIISKIAVTTKNTIFIGFLKCFIFETQCTLSVTQTLKTINLLNYREDLEYEEDVLNILIDKNYYLYDLKLKDNLNFIAKFSSKEYEILTFNTTHYILNSLSQNQDNVYIGQIGYEILFLEIGKKQKEIEFTLQVQNQISEEQISLTIINDDFKLQNQINITQYLIWFMIMLLIILIIYFIRRSKLKLQNQVNTTNYYLN